MLLHLDTLALLLLHVAHEPAKVCPQRSHSRLYREQLGFEAGLGAGGLGQVAAEAGQLGLLLARLFFQQEDVGFLVSGGFSVGKTEAGVL
jgi:hypothetical protein